MRRENILRPYAFRVLLLACSAALLAGCSTFQLTQEPFTPKGKKLAVIAGLTNPARSKRRTPSPTN